MMEHTSAELTTFVLMKKSIFYLEINCRKKLFNEWRNVGRKKESVKCKLIIKYTCFMDIFISFLNSCASYNYKFLQLIAF